MQSLKSELEARLSDTVQELYAIRLEKAGFEVPPSRSLGDLASIIAFDLAKQLKKAPLLIASEIASNLKYPESVCAIKVEGGGYINFFFNRSIYLQKAISTGFCISPFSESPESIIVEHTSINPNKTPHVGHLRNAVLGDILSRLSEALGFRTIVQDYIDNTGVQVADVVIGLTEMRGMSLDEIKKINDRLDSFCWDIYSDVVKWIEADESRRNLEALVIKQLEENSGPYAETGEYVSATITKAHLSLMNRLGIMYNLIIWERDVLSSDLWKESFEILKNRKKIYYADEGEKKGCWVMDLKDIEAFSEMDDPDKILVRSNDTVTYTAKDIAYHFWKCGITGDIFKYKPFYTYEDGSSVWTTTIQPDGVSAPQQFSGSNTAFNVIDVRQSYPQKVVREAVRFINPSVRLHHFAYEMVALTPACAEELGFKLDKDEKNKKYIEMSGRRGLGVKAGTLIDTMRLKSLERIRENNPDADADELSAIAEKVMIGALRYFLSKFNKNKVIAFDFNEALNFEGDTGPYIQYSLVRAKSIIRKIYEAGIIEETTLVEKLKSWNYETITDNEEMEFTWAFLFNLSRYEEILRQAFESLDLSFIASWAYDVAQGFNSYYHKYSILKETNSELQITRLGVVVHYLHIMSGIAGILGLPVPEKM